MRPEITLPPDFDWQPWVERWERMQERYLVRRAERFSVIARMIRATQPSVVRILDLGCGPGSLTLELLEQFPDAHIVGIDFDPTILQLGKLRLARFGTRAVPISADMRQADWQVGLPAPFDAVVSATALHWLAPERLAELYKQLAQLLRPGGIFLNADHVGSDFPPIQQAWDEHREEMRAQELHGSADDWEGFWKTYGDALRVDIREIHRAVRGDEPGVEDGLPLAWHFHALKEGGFRCVDCFWRSDGDAIYGGIRANAAR